MSVSGIEFANFLMGGLVPNQLPEPEVAQPAETDIIEELVRQDYPLLAERFSINSDERAEWYLRKQGGIADEKARVTAQYERMMARLNKQQDSLSDRFGAEFDAYAMARIAIYNGKQKYHDFFQARVQQRTVPGRMVIKDVDDPEFRDRAQASGCITTETHTVVTVDKKKYTSLAESALTQTGELLPGVIWVDAKETVSIQFPKEKK